jgi:Asp-tRNA(Asn)/Glu-tRNA(Gln) amidotransferase A subunit family amidase
VSEDARFAHRDPGGPLDTDPFVVGPAILAPGAPDGPLSGMTFAVKDLFDVAGTRRGDGTPEILAERSPAAVSAPAVEALRVAGATCVGKTVSDELAFSLSGTNVHYGTPENAAAPGAVPGGSSSGSAAVVASGRVDLALGTDTGGSVRVPASYCGIFGLRTTHGRITSAGVMLLAPSFCTVGLFAPDAGRIAEGWRALDRGAGSGSSPPTARRVSELLVVPELFSLADPEVRGGFEDAVRLLGAATGVPIAPPPSGEVIDVIAVRDAFRTIQMYEAWSIHGAWITAHPGALGGGIAARFAAASEVTREAYDAARAWRGEFVARYLDLLGEGRYLLQPAASGPAPPLTLGGPAKDDLRARTLALTAVAGMAGAPVCAIPAVRTPVGPVGIAVVGAPWDDDGVVEIAGAASGALEQHRPS